MQTLFSLGDRVKDEGKGYEGVISWVEVSQSEAEFTVMYHVDFGDGFHPDDRTRCISWEWLTPIDVEPPPPTPGQIDRAEWEQALKDFGYWSAIKFTFVQSLAHGPISKEDQDGLRGLQANIDTSKACLDALVEPFLSAEEK